MEIITGYTGKPHVTSEQDRDVNIGIVGEESYVLRTGMQLAAEVSSNNEIKIRDGVLMHQGCTASIKKNTYDSLTIINGSQGMKRIDLIVARYEKNQDDGTESITLRVIQGAPAESNPKVPSYVEGDIQAGDAISEMPMYQVILDGLNITEVKSLLKTLNGLSSLNDYIVEQGTSGIWSYRKWASGIAECWGTTTVAITKWEAWGTLYEGYPRIESISFPTSLFMTDDVAWQVTANSYMGIVSVESASLVTKLQTPLMWILRPNASTQNDTIRVSMEARGRWK